MSIHFGWIIRLRVIYNNNISLISYIYFCCFISIRGFAQNSKKKCWILKEMQERHNWCVPVYVSGDLFLYASTIITMNWNLCFFSFWFKYWHFAYWLRIQYFLWIFFVFLVSAKRMVLLPAECIQICQQTFFLLGIILR